jgi:hypothetical protein
MVNSEEDILFDDGKIALNMIADALIVCRKYGESEAVVNVEIRVENVAVT